MLDLKGIMTERVEKLLVEVENLLPEKEISIVEMTDKNILNSSDGAAVTGYTDGRETIYLDPLRADEYMLIHEIMHVKLRREVWPQIYPLVPERFTRDLATKFDSLIDHYIFDIEIEDMKIDCTEYREKFTSKFDDWNNDESGLGILINSFIICEGLLFDEPYKTRTIRSLENKSPLQSLDLALKIEEIITSCRLNKSDIRKMDVQLLNFISHWVQEHNLQIPFLRHMIGISPVFTVIDLNKKASKYLKFKSEQMTFFDTNHDLASFTLKLDKTRIKTYVDNNPREISDMGRLFRKQGLKTLLESHNIKYGII